MQRRGLPARAFTGGWGNFGVWSRLLRLLLHFIYGSVQCKMRKLSRKQKATLPLRRPPGCVRKALPPLSVCFCQTGACWHYLLMLLHSVTVSTGGGDSPLLIRAGPSLLSVGHFFKAEGGVGLALPVWWKAENSGRLFVRRALQNLLVTQALGDISRITIAACRGAQFVPVRCQGSGGKRPPHPRLAGEVALLASDCRAGLRTRNKVEDGKVCQQCPSNT